MKTDGELLQVIRDYRNVQMNSDFQRTKLVEILEELTGSKLSTTLYSIPAESDPLFDAKFSAKSTTNLPEGSNLYFTTTRAREAFQYFHNATAEIPKVMTFIGSVSASGNAVVYLTDTGLAGGTALYTNVNAIIPYVNDSAVNYTYGWTVSGDMKTLTVNVKASTGIAVALLGLTLLGVPVNVANGTAVFITVIGS